MTVQGLLTILGARDPELCTQEVAKKLLTVARLADAVVREIAAFVARPDVQEFIEDLRSLEQIQPQLSQWTQELPDRVRSLGFGVVLRSFSFPEFFPLVLTESEALESVLQARLLDHTRSDEFAARVECRAVGLHLPETTVRAIGEGLRAYQRGDFIATVRTLVPEIEGLLTRYLPTGTWLIAPTESSSWERQRNPSGHGRTT